MHDLRVLIVEDNEDDALLLLNELRFSKYNVVQFKRVQSAGPLREALEEGPWDIVLSDFNLPAFNGLEALKIVQASDQDLPFILVSGMIGEETAVEALKAGAHDYLLKDRLSRLGSAVKKELAEAKQRQELRKAQEELATAKEIAEVANKRKSQVLAYVAHEFKNPINAILMCADLVQSDLDKEKNMTYHRYVQTMGEAARQLKDLVQDILDIASVEAGKVQLSKEWVSISQVIEAAKMIVEQSAHQGSIELVIQMNSEVDWIFADFKRLRQIFINLMSNAIKYSHEGATVTVTVTRPPEKNKVAVSVQDNGIGMSPDEIRQLFTDFYRVYNNLGAQHEGVGLGLALTKQLVELHHGEIRVESEVGKGSTFTVVLPVCATEVEHYASPPFSLNFQGR